MKLPPIELALVAKSVKVSPAAWRRVHKLAEDNGARISDVVSACLLFMDEAQLSKILTEQAEIVDALPKKVIGLMRSMEKLSDEERAMLQTILSDD